MLFDIHNVYDQKDSQHHHKDNGGEGVYLRADLPSGHGEDGDGESLCAGAVSKVADDEVIDGVGEGHEEAGENTGHNLGHHHLAEHLQLIAAQIRRRLAEIPIHLPQLRHNVQNDVRHAERDMGEDQGGEAEFQFQEYEKEHQRHTGNDLRVHVGDQGDVHDELAGYAVHIIDADGGGGAKDGGYHRCDQRHEQGVEQAGHDRFVVEQLGVPVQGKAGPYGAAFGRIKGIDDQNADGNIQKQEDDRRVDLGKCKLFHHISTPSMSSSSRELVMLMQSRMNTISTIDIAAPRLGL